MDKISANSTFRISLKQEHVLLALILFVGACLRIVAAYSLSLSNDELSALTRARYDSFSSMIENGVFIDFHPAGIQSLIYYWIKIVGDNPFVFRLPFLFSGVLTVYLIYALGKKWFGSFTGLFSAALFSTFQFSILYSVFARPYSPGLLFGLIAVYAWTILFFPEKNTNLKRPNLFWWVIFTSSMIGCTHTHYFSFVFAGGLGLTGLFFIRKDLAKQYFVSGAIILIAFLPEWEIFQKQLGTGDIGGWLASPGVWYLPQFILHIFNDSKSLTAGILVLAVPGVVSLIRSGKWNKFHTIGLTWFLFSFLTAYLYSIFRHPVIQFSTLYFSFPFLLFILGSGIEFIVSTLNRSYTVVLLTLIIGCAHTVFSKELFSRSQFGVFKDIAIDIQKWEQEFGKGKVMTVINVINPEYINYYFRKLNYEPDVIQWKIEDRKQLQHFSMLLDSLSAPYFCFAWSNSGHPYEMIRMLREKYPVVLKKNAYYNSATYLFSEEGVSICEDPSTRIFYNVKSGSWEDRGAEDKDSVYFKLDSLHTFGPGYKKPLSDFGSTGYLLLTSRIDFKTDLQQMDASVVISFDSSSVPKEYHSLSLEECNLQPGRWQRAYFTRVIPNKVNPELILNSYLYNRGGHFIEFKNFEITIENWDDPYSN